MFRAILVDKDDDGYRAKLTSLEESQLPQGEVLVEVTYSTLNYKDGLAISGKGPVVRQFPLVPGIDFAGHVAASSDPRYRPGDAVLLNGWGVGESHWGGLAQKARVPGDGLIPLPKGFTLRQAMAIGTAGYTAMLCVLALERQAVTPDKGEIVVSGAAGGVGSTAVIILAKLGYAVVAVSGRAEQADHLKALGAAEVMNRAALAGPGKPLARERWAGAVDVAGGHTLANICASTKALGVVTACGLAESMAFPATVAPFILRGVSLIGINSVSCPREQRQEAWGRLVQDLDPTKLESITEEIALSDAIAAADRLMAGQVRGRLVVDVNR